MKLHKTRGRLLATTLLTGITSFAAPVAIMALASAVPTMASAQDLVQGTLSGSVQDRAGSPISGAAVTVTSTTQGFSRTYTTAPDGSFRAIALPAGVYDVSVAASGYTAMASKAQVGVGGTTSYSYTLGSAAGTTEVEEIMVIGAARAVSEFDTTTTGLTVDVEAIAERAPIARSATAVALLAPGVTLSDSAFGDIPTIGGASAGENTYFVNGLNTTKFREFTGSSVVPFEFYQTIEVKTGGYSSEFGRGTGGVLNAVTKSGGNEWEFEISAYSELDSLRSNAPNTYLARNNLDESSSSDIILQAGGPIIRDRLFVYGLYDFRNREAYDQGANSIGLARQVDSPFWGGKIDFLVTEDHRIDFTYWTDESETETRQTTIYSSGAVNQDGTLYGQTGGENYIARYTGVWSDRLTTSLSYGVNVYNESFTSSTDSLPFITSIAGVDADGDLINEAGVGVAFPLQGVNGQPAVNNDRREIIRADVDYYLNFLGNHHFRVGIDQEKLEAEQTLDYSGSGQDYCRPGGFPGGVTCTSEVTGGLWYRYQTPYNAGNIPVGRTDLIGKARRVRIRAYDNDGSWTSDQNAFYIQDSWEVTDQLTINAGVRNESFENKNIAGESFVNIEDQWGARIGVTYDPTGDRSSKLFGFYGRYFLPVAVNTNQRLAGAEFFISDTWSLNVTGGPSDLNADGVNDADGTPILNALLQPGTNADGQVKPITTQVAADIEPMYVDEFIIGYERMFDNGWKAGIKMTYRDLGMAIDDMAIDAAVNAYCVAEGIGGCSSVWSGFHQYVLGNPGQDMTITLAGADLDLTSLGGGQADRVVNLSANDLNYPSAKREYSSIELSLERPFDGTWGVQGSYVWSESQGNYEGALKSDNGQTDPGLSQDFDQPGLVDGAYGLLPNHRAHTFKVFGTYSPIEGLILGANGIIQSPRQFGCIGVHPTDAFASLYGAASWFCDGVSTPRGSMFESEWLTNMDLTVSYTLPDAWLNGMGDSLTLRADIFNVFNGTSAQDYNEFGELAAVGDLDPNYGKVSRYQTPRYVRLGLSYKF